MQLTKNFLLHFKKIYQWQYEKKFFFSFTGKEDKKEKSSNGAVLQISWWLWLQKKIKERRTPT
ncbi:hypothetical protein E2C01_082299 [Portunus trituberculatus]|uniref:Uncharacterized protein n=1 Tax=Portunus trituberculatus TaxID=210409 RepID=A0A5B7J183_PORTR|nr:hypothetical protein [Portunus trituberculatus]